MKAENLKKQGCLQRDSAEHKGYAKAQRSFNSIWKERDSAEPALLERILERGNLNRAYKRVEEKKGAPGSDGMTIEETGAYLREHKLVFIEKIRKGKYTPEPVRRVEIPKPDGGMRKLGIPSVKDRVVQQAVTQMLMPIYEPLFSDNSYGYRPGRSAQDAIQKVKARAEEGYHYAVCIDLSKYFDTIHHEKLLQILRRTITDERVIQIIKRFLKSGVMVNGICMKTEEGSPQGGNISPLLSNIYLNEFDGEMERRGIRFVRYADDIVILAKSERAAKRLLETSTRYLENTLKLKVNQEKSRVVSVFAKRNFKFLGFAMGRNGNGIFIRVHPKSWRKMEKTLKILSSRRKVQSLKPALEKIKVYMRGWLNYYKIASMRGNIEKLNSLVYRRIRMCIWRRWKRPRTKMRNLMKLGIPKYYAHMAANSRKGPWFTANTSTVKRALQKERLIHNGFYDLSIAYQSMHENY